MWEMSVILSWDEFRKMEFDSLEDAQRAMRRTVTQVLGDNTANRSFFQKLLKKRKTHYDEFVQLIRDGCKECYAEKSVPEAIDRLLEVLNKYVTDPNYPKDVKGFTFEPFEDEHIRIILDEKPKALKLMLLSDAAIGKIPGVMLPLEMKQHENTLCAISNKIPGTNDDGKQMIIMVKSTVADLDKKVSGTPANDLVSDLEDLLNDLDEDSEEYEELRRKINTLRMLREDDR